MCIEQRGKCYTAGITPTPSPQSGGGISNDLLKFNTPRLSRLDFLHAPPPTSIMSSTLRPSAPLLARASSQIPTIKTTSLAGLQSTLFNICTIINDPIATVHNLNAVDCAKWKVSKHCLFVFGVHWSVYLADYLLPHEKKKKNVESKARRLLYVPEGPVHTKGERRVQKSSLPKVQSRMAGAEAKHFNVLAQSWRQYELQGVEHLSEVNEMHLRSRKFCSPVEQIPVCHS